MDNNNINNQNQYQPTLSYTISYDDNTKTAINFNDLMSYEAFGTIEIPTQEIAPNLIDEHTPNLIDEQRSDDLITPPNREDEYLNQSNLQTIPKIFTNCNSINNITVLNTSGDKVTVLTSNGINKDVDNCEIQQEMQHQLIATSIENKQHHDFLSQNTNQHEQQPQFLTCKFLF